MIYAWWLPQGPINKSVAKQIKAANSMTAILKKKAQEIANDAIKKMEGTK